MSDSKQETVAALKGIREQLQVISEQLVKSRYTQGKHVRALLDAIHKTAEPL